MSNIDLYTSEYVEKQLEKFYDRKNNHFGTHIRLAKDLVSSYGFEPPATLLDLGCSIGTFALEFALDGFTTFGLDFDQKALDAGKALAKELNCHVSEWICSDARSFSLKAKVDIIICFDLLEHLHDHVITNMLNSARSNLIPNGIFVFHTFPTKYDYIFYKDNRKSLPLIPFRKVSAKSFKKLVELYSKLLDIYFVLKYHQTQKKLIEKTVHPNPLTEERLRYFLEQAGFEIVLLKRELDAINPLKPGQGVLAKRYFAHQPVAYRSLFGLARNRN